MFKKLLAVSALSVAFIGNAFADQLQLNGTITGTCVLSSPVNGTLVVGTIVTPGDNIASANPGGSPATIVATNNQAGAFTLTVASGANTVPSQSNLQYISHPTIASGVNSGATFSGTDASTSRSVSLANAGIDNINVDAGIVRTGGATLIPGSYQLVYDVTCSAI